MKAKVKVKIKILLALFLALSTLTGCTNHSEQALECKRNLTELQQENDQLKTSLSDARQKLNAQSKQITKLEKTGDKRFAKLLRVQRIKLDRLTGGYDADNDRRDDGIVVFLQPIDNEGDIIKTAGEATVKLFSLSDKPTLLGEMHLSPDELSKSWTGKFWTSHFTIRCPFKSKPKDPNITLHIEFTELLTGKTFTAQKLCKIAI